MKVAVCDDDRLFTESLAKQLEEIQYIKEVDTFSDMDTLKKELYKDNYDVIFMDIEWNRNSNGVDLSHELWLDKSSAKIIYVTAYAEKFVEQAFMKKAHVVGFIVKPVKMDVLRDYLDKINSENIFENRSTITVKENGRSILVYHNELLFIESKDHYMDIHTIDNVYHMAGKISDFESLLSKCFVRCHRGFLVNMMFMREFNASELILNDGTVLPIGRKYSENVREKFVEYLSKKI